MSLTPEYINNPHQQQARAELLSDVADMGATAEVLATLAKMTDEELADMCFFFAVVAQRAVEETQKKR